MAAKLRNTVNDVLRDAAAVVFRDGGEAGRGLLYIKETDGLKGDTRPAASKARAHMTFVSCTTSVNPGPLIRPSHPPAARFRTEWP